MALTPETLPRHELVGLPVRVAESTDPGRVGLAGRVVRETTRTLLVRTDSGVSRVPKAGTTFAFDVPASPTDEAAGGREAPGTASEPAVSGGASGDTESPDADTAGEGVASVTVDGDVLLARPARRTEHGVDSTWH